jgi:hypothetical protein
VRASNPLLLRTGALGTMAGGLLFAVWGYLHQDNAPLYFNTIVHILAGIVPVLFMVGLASWGLDRVVHLPCGGLEHAGVLSRTPRHFGRSRSTAQSQTTYRSLTNIRMLGSSADRMRGSKGTGYTTLWCYVRTSSQQPYDQLAGTLSSPGFMRSFAEPLVRRQCRACL